MNSFRGQRAHSSEGFRSLRAILLTPMRPHPALLLERGADRVLIVADLHIGWEISLVQQGIHVPSQTPKMLSKLLQIIESCRPTCLLFLGDVKHTIARVGMEEWRDIPDFFEKLRQKVTNVQVVLGNHDGNLEPLLPKTVEILPSTGLTLSKTGLYHGHAWPGPELLQCRSLVIGHVHPIVAFRDPLGFRIAARVWVKAKIDGKRLAKGFLKSHGLKVRSDVDAVEVLQREFNLHLRASELLIMPCFNDFLGGRAINRRSPRRGRRSIEYLGPVLRSGSVDIDNAETYMLDGTFLGTVDQLRSFT